MLKKRGSVCGKIIMSVFITIAVSFIVSCSGGTSFDVNIIEDHYRNYYEVFIYSFYDSNGDGIGDLKGVSEKLDYIRKQGEDNAKDSLNMGGIWLMPVFPSPTYHKYDVTDYCAIDEQYGTMEDFEELLNECHKRKVALILDLPVNHTSVEHPWFKEAVKYLGTLDSLDEADESVCPYVSYYNFSPEKKTGYERLNDDIYYEARFWSGMPDLNLDNPAVRDEIKTIVKFWLDKGVDGFRLDAVTSYYTDDKRGNIEFISWLKDAVLSMDNDAYLVGEAWENRATYAEYYKSGMESFFDFDMAGPDGVIASAVKGNKGASSYGNALVTEEALYASMNPGFVNAPFYTNHDMARSAGYYAYDDGSRTKLAGALNLLCTGNAFIYYGEELGMKGSGKDENKRAPMQWGEDIEGMCKGPDDMDSFDMKFDALDKQMEDEGSVWNYYRKALELRNTFPVIARGRTELVEELSGDDVCVFTRSMEKEESGEGFVPVLIAINCSEEAKDIDIKSSEASGYKRLSFELNVSEDKVKYKSGKLTLPAFGAAVMTK